MKKTLLAVILAACASSAIAAPTAVLKVKGTLTNSSCSPTLSNSGVVDYGTVHLSDLS
jgi:type 1 fimbria pilin